MSTYAHKNNALSRACLLCNVDRLKGLLCLQVEHLLLNLVELSNLLKDWDACHKRELKPTSSAICAAAILP